MIATTLIPICLVAAGGAVGALLRYAAVQGVIYFHPAPFPVGTMLVNVAGSFLIGLLMARYQVLDSESARLFWVTGVLGGFTTFSAFSWDALQLAQRGALGSAAFYVVGSVALSLVAVAAGHAIAK
jgi:fluoride exporter